MAAQMESKTYDTFVSFAYWTTNPDDVEKIVIQVPRDEIPGTGLVNDDLEVN